MDHDNLTIGRFLEWLERGVDTARIRFNQPITDLTDIKQWFRELEVKAVQSATLDEFRRKANL